MAVAAAFSCAFRRSIGATATPPPTQPSTRRRRGWSSEELALFHRERRWWGTKCVVIRPFEGRGGTPRRVHPCVELSRADTSSPAHVHISSSQINSLRFSSKGPFSSFASFVNTPPPSPLRAPHPAHLEPHYWSVVARMPIRGAPVPPSPPAPELVSPHPAQGAYASTGGGGGAFNLRAASHLPLGHPAGRRGPAAEDRREASPLSLEHSRIKALY